MLRDAEQFRTRLSKLDGAGDIGDHIVSIVDSKEPTEKTKMPYEATEQSTSTDSKPQQSDTVNGDDEN